MSNVTTVVSMKDALGQNKELKLCKSYIKKAHDYQDTMKYDTQSQATFDLYKENVVKFCSVAI